MGKMEEYNLVIYPTYRYVTLNCNQDYLNTEFDKILKILGKYYFNKPALGTDGICSLIKDKINQEWHLNSLKKSIQQKRVSSNQVKTIRRAFRRIKDKNQHFIRIPFSVVPILFFILNLLHSIPISELNDDEKQFMDSLTNGNEIRKCLYNYHTSVFFKKYSIIMSNITDEELKDKYQRLYANLTDKSSVINNTYSEIKWIELTQYIIH